MNKIAIIIHRTSEAGSQKLLDSLVKLEIPPEYDVEVLVYDGSKNKAHSYNEGMVQSDAKYKIYIEESGIVINEKILFDIVKIFSTDSSIGIIGLYGSEMPIDGNFTQSENRYGLYGISTDGKNLSLLMRGKNPIWYQKVHCLEGAFVATSIDMEWDEGVDEIFLIPGQCCSLRKKGYFVAVPMQNDIPWCVFAKRSMYDVVVDQKILNAFSIKYQYIIQPLVSILITTYNQPVFFKEALESALHQDYHNIEIVVGDDSTNTETKKLMQEYIRKYPQIKYYYHNEPLGGQGLENAKFVLNHSHGEFINYLFHDDLFYPQKISTMMKYMVRDLNEQIGMVSSARNLIDENGTVEGQINQWQPIDNEVLNGMEMAEKILYSSLNYIGELTTVLLRKKLLKQSNGEYLMGCFNGIRDKANGDVATWLDVARQGKNCLFLREVLSAFRKHSGQNTYNLSIIINSIIEWLNYVTIFGRSDTQKKNIETLSYYYDKWYLEHKKNVDYVCKNIKDKKIERNKIEFCTKIIDLIEKKEYKKVRELSQNYIRANYEILGDNI